MNKTPRESAVFQNGLALLNPHRFTSDAARAMTLEEAHEHGLAVHGFRTFNAENGLLTGTGTIEHYPDGSYAILCVAQMALLARGTWSNWLTAKRCGGLLTERLPTARCRRKPLWGASPRAIHWPVLTSGKS